MSRVDRFPSDPRVAPDSVNGRRNTRPQGDGKARQLTEDLPGRSCPMIVVQLIDPGVGLLTVFSFLSLMGRTKNSQGPLVLTSGTGEF